MKTPCAANLHNVVTVSQQRLGKRVARLSTVRMSEIMRQRYVSAIVVAIAVEDQVTRLANLREFTGGAEMTSDDHIACYHDHYERASPECV